MKITLHYKLFAAILTAVLAVVVYMSLVMQWSFDRGFLNYVNTIEQEQLRRIAADLTAYYHEKKSWQELADQPLKMARIIVASFPEGRQKEHFLKRLAEHRLEPRFTPSGPLPAEIPSHFFRRIFLLDKNKSPLFGYTPGKDQPMTIDIYYQNRIVGSVGVHPTNNLSNSHQLVFLKQQRVALILVAVAGFLIAAGFSLPLAYRLTRPIRRIAAATRAIASGKYDTRITVTSSDELGQLSHDFNDLAAILEKNQQARQQWVADISHELRTPVTILRGTIEALQDGIYPPTEATYAALQREILHLGVLVDDLYQLSLSDIGTMSYHRAEINPCSALKSAISFVRPHMDEKDLRFSLTQEIPKETTLFADQERLKQLFTNLLTNSLRYTDPGGIIEIRLEKKGDELIYDIQDSAPGVPDEHLDLLFERLHRVDSSRSRQLGGAGLGLSICASIVKGHNGVITAKHSPLGGLWIHLRLPVSG